MAAVENGTNNGTFDALPSENDEDDVDSEECDCDGLGDVLCWERVRMGGKNYRTDSDLFYYSLLVIYKSCRTICARGLSDEI